MQHHTEGCTLWVCPILEPRCHHQAPHLLPLMGGTLALVNPQPSNTQNESDPEALSALKMNRGLGKRTRRASCGTQDEARPASAAGPPGQREAACSLTRTDWGFHVAPPTPQPRPQDRRARSSSVHQHLWSRNGMYHKGGAGWDVAGWTQEAQQSLQERTSRCLGARRCPMQEAANRHF